MNEKPRDRLDRLRAKVYSGSHSSEQLQETDIIQMHDLMMYEYGWIPYQEFKELPIPVFWNLLMAIKRRKEMEQKEYDKAKRK